MARSADDQTAAMVASLPEKTGKSLEQWLKLVKTCGAEKHGQIVKWLKSEHGVTHGYANLIAHHHVNADQLAAQATGDTDTLVDAQYAKKPEMRPIYEALREEISKFGKDVEFAPKKTYVSLRRSKQFALIQPSTKTRVDVGLKFADRAADGRLESSGSWNAMVTHRVRLGAANEVDAELIAWLREAYEQA